MPYVSSLTGNVRLTDFGLAKQFMLGESKTYTFCGTPEYLGTCVCFLEYIHEAAPEVLEGEGYGMAADWWCLGALMYEMLHGLPPFYSTNLQEMYKRVLSEEELPIDPSLSPECQSIIRGVRMYQMCVESSLCM